MSKVWFPWQPPRSPVNIRPGAGKLSPLGVAAQHVITLGTLLLGLMLATGFQGCASAAELLTPHRPTAISPLTIRGFNGPEDMQLTPDGRHIVVSELPLDWAHPQGPSLVLVDLPDDRVHPLSVKMQPEAGWGDPACPVPTALSTHGLFVSQRPDGHVQIIVVNHTGRESIEFIELVNGASGFGAIWRGCVAFEGGLLNDLVAYGTIENFASFNRHIIEADPGRLGTTIYVGGYPSLATQEALRVLAGTAPPDTPIFHWSDIDPDGTWIFHTIERAIGRSIRPHLMSAEIAEKFGKVPSIKTTPARCPPDSGISGLAAYLAAEGAKTLEQEELDPTLPELYGAQNLRPNA